MAGPSPLCGSGSTRDVKMSATLVADLESVYRSIRYDAGEYAYIDGQLVFSQSAFNDRELKPSVDRSSLRPDPIDAKQSPSDGITQLKVADVRTRCKINIVDEKGKPTDEYAVDVIHRPLKSPPEKTENLAHCQIECNPIITSPSRFRRLKEALAALATQHGFLIEPGPDMTHSA